MMASAAPLTLLLLKAERKEWELRQGQWGSPYLLWLHLCPFSIYPKADCKDHQEHLLGVAGQAAELELGIRWGYIYDITDISHRKWVFLAIIWIIVSIS